MVLSLQLALNPDTLGLLTAEMNYCYAGRVFSGKRKATV